MRRAAIRFDRDRYRRDRCDPPDDRHQRIRSERAGRVGRCRFIADSADVNDDHGHGTHVAGTAAAVGNNATGIVGVAYGARVMAVKGFDADGDATDSSLIDGILYAVENGADVINASWGGVGPDPPALRTAVEAAHDADVVFVASAGNAASEIEYSPFIRIAPRGRTYPAAFRQAIAVGASDQTDGPAWFSNYGVKLDVDAAGFDLQTGYGRANAAAALAVEAPLVAQISAPMNHGVFSGDSIELTGTASGPGFLSYTLEYATAAAPEDWGRRGGSGRGRRGRRVARVGADRLCRRR